MIDPSIAPTVVSRLATNTGLDGLGLDRIDGRWDLRGLTTAEPTTGPTATLRTLAGDVEYSRSLDRTRLERVALEDLDLRGAVLPGLWLERVRIHNCRFDGANLQDLRMYRGDVSSTSFAGADLRDSVLSIGPGSTFREVSFVRADLRCNPGLGEFVDCDFSHAKLKGTGFMGTYLERCRFEGRLDGVIFTNRERLFGLLGSVETLVDVDFSACTFRFVEFHRLNLDRVRLPIADDHVLSGNIRCLLDTLVRLGSSFPDPGGLAVIEAVRGHLGRRQRQGVLCIGDLVRRGDSATAQAVREVVDRAAKRCG